MSNRLVSILIAAYNSRYFPAALESALSQDYPAIEIVVCDDSESDAIATHVESRRASARFPIIYDKNPTRLMGRGNVNKCFALSHGEYIKILNDDDLLAPECASRMVSAIEAFPGVNLVTSHRRLVDDSGAALADIPATLRPVAQDALIEGKSLCRAVLESSINFIGEPSSTLFRRASLAANLPDIMRFRGQPVRYFNDVAMWFTLLQSGDAIYLSDSLSAFRRHAGQAQLREGYVDRAIENYRLLCDLCTEAGLITAEENLRYRSRDSWQPRGAKLFYRPLDEADTADWRQREICFREAPPDGIAPAYEAGTEGGDQFSEDRYLALNPDIVSEVRQGAVSALEHFLFHGRPEGRCGVPAAHECMGNATRDCLAPWGEYRLAVDGGVSPCPHHPVVDNLFAFRWSAHPGIVELRGQLLLGTLDQWCANCPSAPLTTTAQLLEKVDALEYGLFGGSHRGRLADDTGPARSQRPDGHKLILIGHAAHRTGGEMLLLALLRHLVLREKLQVVVILLGGGDLEADYRQFAEVYCRGSDFDSEDEFAAIVAALRADGYWRAIANTVVTGPCIPLLKQQGMIVTSLIHELPTSIIGLLGREKAEHVASAADHIIFAAEFVRQGFCETFPTRMERTIVQPQGLLFDPPPETIGACLRDNWRQRLQVGSEDFVVLGVGSGDLRKGPDVFFQVAARAIRSCVKPLRFLWIGRIDAMTKTWLEHDLRHTRLSEHITFLDSQQDLSGYYLAADAFLLTSREDPFPNVVLDSMAVGLPVVAFADAGGAPEILNDGAGIVLPYLDIEAMADAIATLAQEPTRKATIAACARQRVMTRCLMGHYAQTLLASVSPPLPSVSVVIPNYNYRQYLAQRLESILQQTIPAKEIIFLDDASTDDSVEYFRSLSANLAIPVTIIANPNNSGSVFSQWIKGARAASGDLLWIAEADDYCEPTFLESLLHAFRDDKVVLAYAQSIFVDSDGNQIADGLDHMAGMNKEKWEASHFTPGKQEISDALVVRNTVVNVSAALMRRNSLLEVVTGDSGEEIKQFAVAGDWYSYTKMLENGDIYFHCHPLNYQRRHARSVTADKRERLFEEVLRVQKYILDRYPVDAAILGRVVEEQRFYFRHSHPHLGDDANYLDSKTYRQVFGTRSLLAPTGKDSPPPPSTSMPASRETGDAKHVAHPQVLAPKEELRDYRRAESLIQCNRREDAFKLLQSLAERGTTLWEVYNDLGVLAHEQGQLQQAKAYLKYGAGLEFNSTNCLSNLLPIYIDEGEIGYALGILAAILRLSPENQDATEVAVEMLKSCDMQADNLNWLSPNLAAEMEGMRHENKTLQKTVHRLEGQVAELIAAQERTNRLLRRR